MNTTNGLTVAATPEAVDRLAPLPPAYTGTRDALHALAEHVLAAARHAATGRIGLRATRRGFGTPPYPTAGGGERCLRVEGDVLVRHDDGIEHVQPITTLAEAAAFAGVEAGAPAEVFTPTTPLRTGDPLAVDRAASLALGAWYGFAHGVLTEFREDVDVARDTPSDLQLWPEHFDLACDLGPASERANYGASPGDEHVADPYLYVGPWHPQTEHEFWDARTFPGALLTYGQLLAADDARATAFAFFRRGRSVLGAAP